MPVCIRRPSAGYRWCRGSRDIAGMARENWDVAMLGGAFSAGGIAGICN